MARIARGHTAGLLATAAALSVATPPAVAQQRPLELERLSGPIEVDGTPDEPAWRDIAAFPLTQYAPVFRGTPRQRTEIRVAYDDENFYAAGWFYDDEPGGIRINSLYRDRWNGDDAFAIYIDAFNDERNAKWFGTTPGGIRFDQLVSDDGATLNGSWDTFWTARTTVTERGWFAEVRIPFSSLGFLADDAGDVVMGLTVTRLVSRTGERVTFPAIDPAFQFRQPSVARDVVLRGVRTGRPLYVSPYALTGVDRRAVANGNEGFGHEQQTSAELGVDVRYPLAGDLTLDVTVNTDFAQVEADDQQIALDRFPLFYPERRRFFQENSGVFDFALGSNARVFHSRRIGLTPDLKPIPVLGGARLVGRAGAWDLGLLNMQTAAEGDIPSENFGVLRLRRSVLNPYSTAGVMLTSRAGGGAHNLVLAADANVRVFGDDYLTAKWAGSVEATELGSVRPVDQSHVYVAWQRRTQRGLMYNASFKRSGRAFRPEMGFLPRTDFTGVNALVEYYVFMDDDSRFRRVWPGALAFSTFRNRDGALESGMYAAWLQWETKAGGGGWIEPKLFIEDVAEPFVIGAAVDIPAGRYHFADLQLVLRMPTGAKLRTTVDARAGTYFDGTRAQLIVTPTWNISPHLELGGGYQLTLLRFPDRNQRADIHLARLRVRTALNARASGNALVQYSSTTGRLDFNIRLRYAFAEGTDLWLVYNEGLDTDRARVAGPRPPLSLSRALIVKYTRTFGF